MAAATTTGLTFLTGVPGFIGTRLARRLLHDPDRRLALLVYPDRALLDKARAFAAEAEVDGACAGRVEVLAGDISRPRLGLDARTYERLEKETTRAFHLAALYNLAAPRQLSYAVNVEGTRNVLDLLERAKGLERLVYFSTMVVSGDREGLVYESELEMGQRFRNYYEETKFLAEVEVRRRLGDVLAAVVRPAVVIGDSRTGAIDKYDGPYYFIRSLVDLERRGKLGLMARLLAAGHAPALFHLVPVDYAVEAACAIEADEGAVGNAHHLIDPHELTVADFRRLVLARFGVRELPIDIPAGLIRTAFRLPGVASFAGMPRQALDYLDHDVRYDHANTDRAVLARGIRCPPIASYLDTLIAFVRSHPKDIPVALLNK